MTASIDYYFSPISPFTYLAGDDLENQAPGEIRYHPVDLALVFAETGGVPLGQRAKQRLDYRMAELRRIAAKRGATINFTPKYFPVDPKPATKLLLAVRDNTDQISKVLKALLTAVWVEERDVSNAQTLTEIMNELGLDPALVEHSNTLDQQLESETREAIAAGVFGFPFYIVEGEPFWGQDRLDEALETAKRLS